MGFLCGALSETGPPEIGGGMGGGAQLRPTEKPPLQWGFSVGYSRKGGFPAARPVHL